MRTGRQQIASVTSTVVDNRHMQFASKINSSRELTCVWQSVPSQMAPVIGAAIVMTIVGAERPLEDIPLMLPERDARQSEHPLWTPSPERQTATLQDPRGDPTPLEKLGARQSCNHPRPRHRRDMGYTSCV